MLRKSIACNPTSEFVFCNKDETMINYKGLSSSRLKCLCRKVGITDFTVHGFRHTFANQYMLHGGTIFDLKELLGHSDIRMTLKYAHFSPNHLKDLADTVRYGFGEERNIEFSSKVVSLK